MMCFKYGKKLYELKGFPLPNSLLEQPYYALMQFVVGFLCYCQLIQPVTFAKLLFEFVLDMDNVMGESYRPLSRVITC